MPSDSYSRMDSTGSTESVNDPTKSIAINQPPGRSQQNSGSESEDGQARFVLAGTDGSPPKILSMDEVQEALSNIKNMTLAHEIAVNPEFRLTPYEPAEASYEKRVKDVLHKAFWDQLRIRLATDPPDYEMAIGLIMEIKECFVVLITENNKKALERVNEILDTVMIRQQAEKGTLDFKSYADFIINVMSKICAPVRDEQVAKLSELTDVVETFRGIMETMSVMKLDMANCFMDNARAVIRTHSVEYEKEKFKEYLKLYKYGFPYTEQWLHRNKPANQTPRLWIEMAILDSFCEFLDWNRPDDEFPEILSMDKERLLTFTGRALRLCACASTIAIASVLPIIGQNIEQRTQLAQQIEILLQGVNTNKELEDALENIWLQLKSFVDGPMDEQIESTIKNQILQLANKQSPVWALMFNRLRVYMKAYQIDKAVPPTPPGYADFINEIQTFGALFKRLTTYNYAVFGEYFIDILNKSEPAQPVPKSDPSELILIEMERPPPEGEQTTEH